jgi:hypothetical protein
MRKSILVLCIVAFAITSTFMTASGQPSGLEKKGKIPSGFSQGEKSGWQDEFPPGWDKKRDKEKNSWYKDIQKRRNNIVKAAKKKGMSDSEAESAANDFEKAARKGVDAKKAENLVKNNIKKGKKADEMSRSVAEESGKIIEKKNMKEQISKSGEKDSGKGKK